MNNPIKICKVCGSSDTIKNRRICKKCKSLKTKNNYSWEKKREQYSKEICPVCNGLFYKWKKHKIMCTKCFKESLKTGYKNNQYKCVGCRNEHRVLAETILKRKLDFNEIVHHLDEDVTNNTPENLWVLSRGDHAKLHNFLRTQKILCKNFSEIENFVIDKTDIWVAINNCIVIKLKDV
jgi:hypothetical protein